jgi:hypothetical protein
MSTPQADTQSTPAPTQQGQPQILQTLSDPQRFPNQIKRRQYEEVKKRSLVACRDFVRDFIICERNHTYLVAFKCRPQNNAAKSCQKT